MKSTLIVCVAAMALAGCQKAESSTDTGFTVGKGRGRYQGVTTYSPGRMWAQIANAQAPASPQAATLNDDEQVIVIVDTSTGQVRQCGNLSGACIAFNPWRGEAAPARLAKHAADLDREAAASEARIEAEASLKPKP